MSSAKAHPETPWCLMRGFLSTRGGRSVHCVSGISGVHSVSGVTGVTGVTGVDATPCFGSSHSVVAGTKEVPKSLAAGRAGGRSSSYLVALTWCFTFFNTVRVLAYLPTVVAIARHGDSTQHSLWTWLTWLGANLTMAAWLFEQNGATMNRAIAVNLANAGMCLVTSVVIVAFRL